MCNTLGIKYKELVCDMPIRWNSTDKMLRMGLEMEKAICTVLGIQDWDKSVKLNLTPTEED
jgi:hypothetical protein